MSRKLAVLAAVVSIAPTAGCATQRTEPKALAEAYVAAVNGGTEDAIDALFMSRDTIAAAMTCDTPERLATLREDHEERIVSARNDAKATARALGQRPVKLVSSEMKGSDVQAPNAYTKRGCTNNETLTTMKMRLVLADADGKEVSRGVSMLRVGEGGWYFSEW